MGNVDPCINLAVPIFYVLNIQIVCDHNSIVEIKQGSQSQFSIKYLNCAIEIYRDIEVQEKQADLKKASKKKKSKFILEF